MSVPPRDPGALLSNLAPPMLATTETSFPEAFATATDPSPGPIIARVGDELITALEQVLTAHEDVVVAYLFGSASREELRPRSDVDVGVLIAIPPSSASGSAGLTRASLRPDLQADLQEAAHRSVDLVVLNHASPDLVHRVLRDGVILIERDRSARIRFEVDARNAYFDVLPFLNRYREAALR